MLRQGTLHLLRAASSTPAPGFHKWAPKCTQAWSRTSFCLLRIPQLVWFLAFSPHSGATSFHQISRKMTSKHSRLSLLSVQGTDGVGNACQSCI